MKCRNRPAQPSAGPLISANTDGSSAHGDEDLSDDTGYLICRGLALIVFVVSVVFFITL